MFYSKIRPITQNLNNYAIDGYKQQKLRQEIKMLVQDEIAKIAIRTYNSPYIEDHYNYIQQRVGSASEADWKNPPAEPQDTEVSLSETNLKMLNII